MNTTVPTGEVAREAAVEMPASPPPTYVPHQIQPYLDIGNRRGDFPLCLYLCDGQPVVRSLRDLFDELVEQMGLGGDDGERLRRAVLKVEAAARQGTGTRPASVLDLWDRHAMGAITSTARTAEAQETLAEHLVSARAQLPQDAELAYFGSDVAPRLLVLAGGTRPQLNTAFLDGLETLTIQLEELLQAPSGSGGSRFRGYSNGEIDAGALAELLGRVATPDVMPARRRARLEELLHNIRSFVPVLLGEASEESDDLWRPSVLTSVVEAREQAGWRVEALTTFFRSVHQAALELENAYSEEKHEAFFQDYVPAPEEMTMCPPVLLHLDAARLESGELDLLLDLLGSRLPVKALVTVGGLFDGDSYPQIDAPPRRTRLGAMAMGIGSAFVAQAVQTQPHRLWQALAESVQFDGPALVSVFTGDDLQTGELDPYLATAAALESRSFPAFTYDPSRGEGWANRFDLSDNPSASAVWSEEADDAAPFTTAEFLLCDARFRRHFTPVADDRAPDLLVPLGEYLALDAASTYGRIPFITGATGNGTAAKLAVSPAIVGATRQAAEHWRGLQELGGINNSYAERAVEALRKQLEAEKAEALQEAEDRHREALSRATGELADEIVANIAAGLLNVEHGAAPRPAAPARPVSKPETPAKADADPVATEPTPTEDEEEEALSFDEAYVETPRCTTCNECTTINGRMFAYNGDKQAEIVDLSAGTFRELVLAAEKCPVRIIHPGKPLNPDEPGLADLVERAKAFQ